MDPSRKVNFGEDILQTGFKGKNRDINNQEACLLYY